MNLHLIFLSGQVLIFSWGVSPSRISQEESPPIGGSVARLLRPCRRSPSPSTKLCRSLTGLFLSFVFGSEVNRDLLKPRADADLCVVVSTLVSAPGGCIHAGVSCFVTYKDGWMSLKSTKHWPKPASADVSGVSCWLRKQIFWKCHVCVYFAASCEMERVPVRGPTRGLLPAYLDLVPWRAQRKSALLTDEPGGMQGGVGSGIILTWWTRSSGCVSAGHIHAGYCSIPRWVPGAMQFIIQFLTPGQMPSVN